MQRCIEIVDLFSAMNTGVKIILSADSEKRSEEEKALRQVRELFRTVESTLSRFKSDSELSIMNSCAGRPFKASLLLFEVVQVALEFARLTQGLFDPTVLGELLSAGYYCSFEKLVGQNNISPASLKLCTDHTWKNIILDESAFTIYLPPGCGIDLGGIGKGWTVDKACALLKPFPGYAIDAGGDIRVGGNRADGSPWTAGVADPFDENRNLRVIELHDEAICTSTTMKRKWQCAGGQRNHIIDPRTGTPSESGVISVTVIADSATRAETLTKSALILGPEGGRRFLENQRGIRGLSVLKNGQIVETGAP
jgi:FAD:protein FMN transferase